MANIIMTVDEIISTVKRTERPTLFVEGSDDLSVFSEYGENFYDDRKYIIQQCYGRSQLLQIFNRRNEINQNKTVTFFADKDMWVLTGVPIEFKELLVTEGYSIENDIFKYSKNDVISRLITKSEYEFFLRSINDVVKWFAFECELFISGHECKMDIHINEILCEKKHKLKKEFLTRRKFRMASEEMLANVSSDDFTKLRGKFLFQTLVRIFNKRKKSRPKYGYPELFNLCITFAEPRMKEYFNEIFDSLFNSNIEDIAMSEVISTRKQSAASSDLEK